MVTVTFRGTETLLLEHTDTPETGVYRGATSPRQGSSAPLREREGPYATGTCGFLRLPDGHTDPSDVHGQGGDARRGDHGCGHGHHRRLCQRHLSWRGSLRLHLALCLQLRSGDPGLNRRENGSPERFRTPRVAVNTAQRRSSGEKLTRLNGRPEASGNLDAD